MRNSRRPNWGALALVVCFAAQAAAQQAAQIAVPRGAGAPALGQLGALLRGAVTSGPSAAALAPVLGGLQTPISVLPAAPQALALPASAVASSNPTSATAARGADARKIEILLQRAAGSSSIASAPSTQRPAAASLGVATLAARAVLERAAVELKAVSVEQLRAMPVEELDAWAARLLEGGVWGLRAGEGRIETSPAIASLAGRLGAALHGAAPPALSGVEGEAGPTEAVPAPAPAAPAKAAPSTSLGASDADKINWKTVAGLFSGRSLSIAAFIATSIAYPFAAVPVVGWAGFGVLMAFGPMAGIAAGPIAGKIIDRLGTRTAMVINAALVGLLQLVLPAFSFFGVLNFGTLLIASLAQGWLLSTVMTTEGAFIKRLFPAKHLGPINGLLQINYFAVQVILGLLVGLGSIVDKWNPFMVFAGAAGVNLLAVVPLILLLIPNVLPAKAAAAAGAATVKAPFWKSNWKGLLALALALATYPLLGSPLPVAAALLFWISRSANFGLVWRGEGAEPMEGVDPGAARKRLRYAMLFMALGATMLYPLQAFVLPNLAQTLVGASGKGLLLGQFLGSLFFGNMISTAAQAKLPGVKLFGRKLGAERLVQALVAALAAAWAFMRLAPGSLPIAAAAAAAAVGLMFLAQKLTAKGWIQLVGTGFAAIWLPVLAYLGIIPLAIPVATMLSLVVVGLSYGPSFVSLITYFQRGARTADMGKIAGIQGSFFNAAISIGYGLAALVAGALSPTFPALLAVLGAYFAAGGLLYWLAPRWLPGLPAKHGGYTMKPYNLRAPRRFMSEDTWRGAPFSRALSGEL